VADDRVVSSYRVCGLGNVSNKHADQEQDEQADDEDKYRGQPAEGFKTKRISVKNGIRPPTLLDYL
jgi:hypothetical protein